MKTQMKLVFVLVAILILNSYSSFSKGTSKHTNPSLSKITAGTAYALMNANNVTCWVRGDGFFNWLISQSWNGEFPPASGVGTIFSEGIVFGGFVNDGLYSQQLRITGDTYFIGMRPGCILTDASGNSTGPEDINSSSARVYGVRPDMPPTIAGLRSSWPDLTTDAATFFQISSSSVSEANIQTIATQYFTDWTLWPATKGAPWFIDTVKVVRNDAAYDATNPHYIPGIPGATKTIWFVCNDLDSSVTQTFTGSPPMGMEEQMTLWAYASSTPLNDVIFKQVKLIYKGKSGRTGQFSSRYDVYCSMGRWRCRRCR